MSPHHGFGMFHPYPGGDVKCFEHSSYPLTLLFCITVKQNTHTQELFVASLLFVLSLCPLGSPGTIMPLFQAIAKPNLPHKLYGLHLKGEGIGWRRKREREQQREKAKDKPMTVKTNLQTKQRNTATQSSKLLSVWICLVPPNNMQVSPGNICGGNKFNITTLTAICVY